jgi:hypothetical protein
MYFGKNNLNKEYKIFQETEVIVSKVKRNRSSSNNEVIEFYNRIHKGKLLSEQLGKESIIVALDSLKVLAEFEKLFGEVQAI